MILDILTAIACLCSVEGPPMTDTKDDDYPPCNHCEGLGRVPVFRNRRGEVDYIDGRPTGETAQCDMCHGEGVEL